jgi:hypothetical protein
MILRLRTSATDARRLSRWDLLDRTGVFWSFSHEASRGLHTYRLRCRSAYSSRPTHRRRLHHERIYWRFHDMHRGRRLDLHRLISSSHFVVRPGQPLDLIFESENHFADVDAGNRLWERRYGPCTRGSASGRALGRPRTL